MNSVLVLGINGFSGRYFQDYITKNNLFDGYNFTGVDKNIEKMIDIEYIEADLVDPGSIEDILTQKEPDYIINYAGLFGADNYDDLYRINAEIPRRIMTCIAEKKLKVKKILLIGSAAEYGMPMNLPVNEDHPLHPISPYGLTKAIQEVYSNYFFQNNGVPISIARTFNILGKGLSPKLSVGSFVNQINSIESEGEITAGNIETKRDFLDINDVVDAYWRIVLSGKPGQSYNVCNGESISIKEILDYLIKESGKAISIKIDNKLIRKNDIMDIYGDNMKLKADTGWTPLSSMHDALSTMLVH